MPFSSTSFQYTWHCFLFNGCSSPSLFFVAPTRKGILCLPHLAQVWSHCIRVSSVLSKKSKIIARNSHHCAWKYHSKKLLRNLQHWSRCITNPASAAGKSDFIATPKGRLKTLDIYLENTICDHSGNTTSGFFECGGAVCHNMSNNFSNLTCPAQGYIYILKTKCRAAELYFDLSQK